jgi:hypothetical protein
MRNCGFDFLLLLCFFHSSLALYEFISELSFSHTRIRASDIRPQEM